MPDVGDKVKVVTKTEEIDGILMPEEREFCMIKLGNGYNIGIDKRRIKEIKLVEKKKERKKEEPKTKQEDLPKVAILHTGGTIASKVDYDTGGVVARFSPQEIIDRFPEIKDIANISSKLVRNMSSEDMRFGHYNILAREAEREIKKGVNGIVITHGTDTMHYTSAALAFMLKDLPVPVILVGAQRSSDRGSSDAALNLISAVYFIIASDFAEVAVCMHENLNDEECVILPGTKCRKMHSSRRDAFKAVNTAPWARVNFKEKKINFLKTGYNKASSKKLRVIPFKENLKVGLVKTYPNMHTEAIRSYINYDGLILEGTGLGHLPINEIDDLTKENRGIYDAIGQLIVNGTIVAITSQTIFGSIDLNVYTPGRKIKDMGVLGNYLDMTPETAYIKIAWLLSNYPKGIVKELFSKNLVGEISERLEDD